jgi:hypothetical protein
MRRVYLIIYNTFSIILAKGIPVVLNSNLLLNLIAYDDDDDNDDDDDDARILSDYLPILIPQSPSPQSSHYSNRGTPAKYTF